MSSEDECDYMSDDFLAKCISSGSKGDIRPGLIHDRSKQRQVAIEKRKAETDEENKKRHKPQSVFETERRDAGLREAISTSNKGFAMLQKMGYQPGKAIGKSGKGLVEPVSIELKSGRGGLGREAALKELAESKSNALQRWRLRRKEEAVVGTKDYRLRIAAEARRRQAEGDLRASQKACHHLDEDSGYDEPLEKWFWPEIKTIQCEEASKSEKEEDKEEDKDSDEEEEEELEPEEKLEVLTEYLRRTYFFCTWCGTKFEGKTDLEDNCPGNSRDEH